MINVYRNENDVPTFVFLINLDDYRLYAMRQIKVWSSDPVQINN